jgi:hypothetical protein
MSNPDLAAWIQVALGVLSLLISIVALWKNSQTAIRIRNLEARVNTFVQSAVQNPDIATGGGGGGGPGGGRGGDGGSVNYQPTQANRGRQG